MRAETMTTIENIARLLDTVPTEKRQGVINLFSRKESEWKEFDLNDNEQQDHQFSENGLKMVCPSCGCYENIIKFGRTSKNLQRYRCRDCGKTFTGKSNTMINRSRLTDDEWVALIEGVINNQPLSQIADKIHKSIPTVWNNRKKLLRLLEIEQNGGAGNNNNGGNDTIEPLSDIVQADEHFVRIMFKGKRDPAFFVNTLGRLPRHHRSLAEVKVYLKNAGLLGQFSSDTEIMDFMKQNKRIPNSKKDQVCLVSCIDGKDNIILEPACIGMAESKHIEKSLKDRVTDENILVTDQYNGYIDFASTASIEHQQVPSGKHRIGPYNLARINSLHSRVAMYFGERVARTPASKYLGIESEMFIWLDQHRNEELSVRVSYLYALIYGSIAISQRESLQITAIRKRALPFDTKGVLGGALTGEI